MSIEGEADRSTTWRGDNTQIAAIHKAGTEFVSFTVSRIRLLVMILSYVIHRRGTFTTEEKVNIIKVVLKIFRDLTTELLRLPLVIGTKIPVKLPFGQRYISSAIHDT